MELGAIFVGLAMLVASVPFVVRPFREKRLKGDRKSNIRPNPEERRKADLSALLDLDFDFRTGKVSEEDYSTVRAQLVTDAAKYIQAENSIEDDQLEAMIRARKASQALVQKCSNCGEKVEPDSCFCSQCGTPVGNNCPSCGKPVQDGDLFCTACGAKMELTLERAV
jgi:hypothetical protein